MKRIFLSSVGCVFSLLLFAQQENLTADQNPNFKLSQVKYTGNADVLQQTNNTTVQNTYKAFDWYANKQTRRQERISFNRQLRLLRAQQFWFNQQGFNGFNNCNNGCNNRCSW